MADTATYLGVQTAGGCVVGLDAAFGRVGSALLALNNTILAYNAQLETQAEAVLTAKAAIRIPAVALPSVQVDASFDTNLGLTADLADPAAYLTGLLEGLATVQASLEASLPVVQLTDTINANLDVGVDFSAQIAEIDLQLAALVSISAAISAIIAALLAATVAVSAALSLYVNMTATLATPGAFALIYSGTLTGFGAALDAVTPSTGLPGSTQIFAPVMLVQQADNAAVNAVRSIYRTL